MRTAVTPRRLRWLATPADLGELRRVEAFAILLLVLKSDEPHRPALVRRVVVVPDEIRQTSTDRDDPEDARRPGRGGELADARMRRESPAQEGERRPKTFDVLATTVAREPAHLCHDVFGEPHMEPDRSSPSDGRPRSSAELSRAPGRRSVRSPPRTTPSPRLVRLRRRPRAHVRAAICVRAPAADPLRAARGVRGRACAPSTRLRDRGDALPPGGGLGVRRSRRR